MAAHLHEWLTLIVKWFHFIVGIAWIGASFYFNWLENTLNRTQDLRDELAGNLWAIHGGGFYYLEKYKVAPGKLPETLHWFKWEAYFTWISGFCLLAVLYYWNANSFMVDPSVSTLTAGPLIAIGCATLLFGWVVYDLMCRSPLVNRQVTFAALGFTLTTVIAWALCQVMAPRAAYIHVGAMLGTIMAANVFFVIIPSQKAVVKAAEQGDQPDGRLGKAAGLRSRHNNYITLPVLFIMISHHFPSTFSHTWNWAILAGISFAGAAVRHYFNIRHLPEKKVWVLPVAAGVMIITAWFAAPRPTTPSSAEVVPFVRIAAIINNHCLGCHSSAPTDDIFKVAPNGVKFETPEQIIAKADLIKNRVVVVKNMPLVNKTNMTDEERATLGRWIDAGAPLN